MAITHELIQTVTVGSGGAASIEFTSIPQTYTDLLLKLSARTNRASTEDAIRVQFNASGGTAYTTRIAYGSGSAAASTFYTSQAYLIAFSVPGNTATTYTYGNGEIYLPKYAGSTNKSASFSLVTENNATAATLGLSAGLWASTAAITRITISPNSGTLFDQYSSISLYGIKNT